MTHSPAATRCEVDLDAAQARTILLSPPQVPAQLDMAHALEVSGLTRAELLALLEDGVVYAETATGRLWRGLSRDHLFAYLTRVRRQPLTLFTALLREADERGVRLDEGAFQREQSALRAQVREGSICRLLRQDRRAPDGGPWEIWFRGHYRHAVDLISARNAPRAAQAEHLAHRGVRVRTLWVPRAPLTPYQHYVAAALHGCGFPVRVLASTLVRHLEHAQHHPLPDLTAYASAGRVYLRTYTALGRADGGVVVSHPGLCTRLCEQIEDLHQQGSLLADFHLDHGDRPW
ncbi:DUF6879 family protein [Nocardiopsis synnemataformans]|uniref:DUF6879 family protein n=1 Tax=Nocardiopsis synnemataformans TaxID=61305 RepID=UPI003EB76E80